MVKHECSNCLKCFNHKSNYDQHLKRKKSCLKVDPKIQIIEEIVPIVPLMDPEINKLQCCGCFKMFSSKTNRIKHEKFSKCFLKPITDENKITKLEEELKLAKMQIDETNKKLEMIVNANPNINNSTNNSTNNSHNNTTNVQNNYTVNMYGKENVSHITDAQLLKILNQGFKSVPAYISLKYFSDAMPENSNVCNTNINSPNILVFNGKKWELKDKKDVIEQMYGCNFDELEEKFHEFKEADKMQEKSAERFSNYITEGYTGAVIDNISKDINKLLYNERDKSLKNKKISKV
jgi:hypothetical protein